MKKIPEEVRQAIRDLYAQGDLTYPEVAAKLSVTENCVRETLGKKRTKTLPDRFWEKVDKSAGPNGCWIWTGSFTPSGYGQIYVNEVRRPVIASRVSLYMVNGVWPDEACHRCDNPPCVNPSHLFDGTRSDNMKDCVSKGRNKVPTFKGLQVWNGKLSSDDVFNIRTLSHLCTPQSLAAAFGVSRGHIVNVASYRDRKSDT